MQRVLWRPRTVCGEVVGLVETVGRGGAAVTMRAVGTGEMAALVGVVVGAVGAVGAAVEVDVYVGESAGAGGNGRGVGGNGGVVVGRVRP